MLSLLVWSVCGQIVVNSNTVISGERHNGMWAAKGGVISDTRSGDNCELTISGCWFTSTSATEQGGAIYTSTPGSVRVDQCHFQNCSAVGEGGAFYLKCKSVEVTGCDVSGCSGEKGASSIYMDWTQLTFKDNVIQNSEADVDYVIYPGTAYSSAAELVMVGCTFDNNGMSFNKQFLLLEQYFKLTRFEGCTFMNIGSRAISTVNRLQPSWDDPNIGDCTVQVEGCTFKNIVCGNGGAVVPADCWETIVSKCVFEDCTAQTGGAAICITGGPEITGLFKLHDINISNCGGTGAALIRIEIPYIQADLSEIHVANAQLKAPTLVFVQAGERTQFIETITLMSSSFTNVVCQAEKGFARLDAKVVIYKNCSFVMATTEISSFLLGAPLTVEGSLSAEQCVFDQ